MDDAVPPDRKVEARAMAATAIRLLAGQAPVLVRVNADPELLQGDIASLPLAGLVAVLLPKVESAAQVQAVAAMLARRGGTASGTVCIHPRQVPVANSGFSPSDQELAWARKAVDADDEARAAASVRWPWTGG